MMQVMETSAPDKKKDDYVKSGLFLIACALVFLAVAYFLQPDFYPLYLDHTETVGTVTAVNAHQPAFSFRTGSHWPVVTYRDAAGSTVTFESRMHTSTIPGRYKTGMVVPVIYTEFQGKRLSMIKDFSSMLFIFGLFAGIAAFLALNGFWLLFKGMKSSAQQDQSPSF